mgnify:FL=1
MNKTISIKLEKNKKLKKKYYNDISNNDQNYNNNILIDNKFNKNNQIIFINNLYLNSEFREKKELTTLLNSKINGYKQQDIKKKNNNNNLISINEVIEKLVISKLQCYYCKNNLYIFYLNVREKLQWTLDRIDNNKNHTNDNTLISCLDCNLKRRTKNKDHFLFTKQLNIIKSN